MADNSNTPDTGATQKLSRASLKAYFQTGKFPSASNFSDLIDSMVNEFDDGISRVSTSADQGIGLSAGKSGNVLSFYASTEDGKPSWQFSIDSNNNLLIQSVNETGSTLVITADGKMGIGVSSPSAQLEVNGTVKAGSFQASQGITAATLSAGNQLLSASGSVNGQAVSSVNADKKWHQIYGPCASFAAFELIATAGDPAKDTKWILAAALVIYGPGKRSNFRITKVSKGGWFCNKIKLKWKRDSENGKYYLCIRTGVKYPTGTSIQFYINNFLGNNPGGANS